MHHPSTSFQKHEPNPCGVKVGPMKNQILKTIHIIQKLNQKKLLSLVYLAEFTFQTGWGVFVKLSVN